MRTLDEKQGKGTLCVGIKEDLEVALRLLEQAQEELAKTNLSLSESLFVKQSHIDNANILVQVVTLRIERIAKSFAK